jgi:hypothetical protein
MFKFKSIVASALITLFSAIPSQAYWHVAERQVQNPDFVISIDEAVEVPQDNKTYAYIEYGVIAKIVYWNANSGNSYITAYIPASSLNLATIKNVTFLAKMPEGLKVNYTSLHGDVRAEAINQGDVVTVVESLDPNPLASQDISIPVTTQVVSTSVNSDYSTSITLAPPVNTNPNQTVEVQVITNGISFTSVATDNTSNPITINNLPSNEYVTVQTVIRDITTDQSITHQDVPIITADANIPVLVNARDSVQDKATISAPAVESVVNGDVKSGIISFAPIANFDPSTTLASIMVVGPNGSTTSIGIDGNGGTVNVSDLLATGNYTVKMVIRDINSGEETIINGAGL